MLEQDHGQNVSRSGNETARAQNVQANKTNRLGICKSGIEQAAMLFIHTHTECFRFGRERYVRGAKSIFVPSVLRAK